MKFPIQNLIYLFDGLSSLDGYFKLIQEGTQEKSIKVNYKLSGKFRVLVGRNLNNLKTQIEIYQKARNDLIMEFSNNTGEVKGESIGVFQKENTKMLEEEIEIKLIKFKLEQLDLDNNPIPPSVISNLYLLLEDIDQE